MFLSYLTDKTIYTGKNARGVCRGVALSLKSHAVKYLLCSSAHNASDTNFSIHTDAVVDVENQITLSRLRPVFPKNCAPIFIGRPVYDHDGSYLGKITDLEMQDFNATMLYTDKNIPYPITAITACSDAVILKKTQPFPIGQRIPAPLVLQFTDKTSALVTKPILKNAIQQSALVKLTLSLPPFNVDFS